MCKYVGFWMSYRCVETEDTHSRTAAVSFNVMCFMAVNIARRLGPCSATADSRMYMASSGDVSFSDASITACNACASLNG